MFAVPIFEEWVWPAQFEFEMNEGSNLESKIELNLAMERFCDARLFHCVGIKRNVGSVNSKQNRNVAVHTKKHKFAQCKFFINYCNE